MLAIVVLTACNKLGDCSELPEGISSGEMADLEDYAVELINADRALFSEESSGAEPLSLDRDLSAVARCHARDMCQRGYFDHAAPNGDLADARLSRVLGAELGEDYYAWAENIAYAADGTTGDSEAAAIEAILRTHHLGYMDECQCGDGCPSGKQAGHRANILSPVYSAVGIGVWYCADDGAFYNVQLFWNEGVPEPSENPYCSDGFTADPPDPFSAAQ